MKATTNCTNKLCETKYSPKAIDNLKKIVRLVTTDSKQELSHIDYNNWTNHSEYSKGY